MDAEDLQLAQSSLEAIAAFERLPKISRRAAAWQLLSGAIENGLEHQWSEMDMILLVQRIARERDAFLLENP